MNIVTTGSIAIDRIMNFPGKYADVIKTDKLHVLSLSVLIDQLKDTAGGIAGNIAYNLALLKETPILYGAVGENARNYMERLAHLGVNTTHLKYSDQATATFTVMTDQDDCQVGGFFPGAMADASELDLKEFNPDEDFIIVSAHYPEQMHTQVQICQERGFRLCYDASQQISSVPPEHLRAGLEAAEIMMVNDYELGLLSERTGLSEDEIKAQLKVLVVTLGSKGAAVYEQGQKQTVPAVKLETVTDPTGAGDAFRAGFLYGYVRNWELATAAQLGCVVASFAVEHHGTQEHSYTLEDLKERWNKTYTDQFPL